MLPETVSAVAEAVLRVVCPVTVRVEAVVVASVVVPTTVSLPFVLKFPCASARKLRFSAHVEPFQ